MSNARVNGVVREAYVIANPNARINGMVREIWVHDIVGLVQITGGNFQDCLANPIANGYLTVRLVSDSQQIISTPGGEVFSGTTMTMPLDMTGNVAGKQYLWSNDSLHPSSSYYLFRLFDKTGIILWQAPLIGVIPDVPSYNLAGLLRP